jgi:hypothetical protein
MCSGLWPPEIPQSDTSKNDAGCSEHVISQAWARISATRSL